MSFAAMSSVIASLISSQYDLELEIGFINQHRHFLQTYANQLTSEQADLDPSSQAAKALQARVKQLNEAEKQLDIKMNMLQQKLKSVEQLKQGCQQGLGENIKQTFRNPYAGNG